MRLPFLRSKDPAADRGPRTPVADDAAAVDVARTRARRRLIGALVLLIAGVIGFPLLFETQPRPLPVDTPIEVRPRDLAAAPVTAPRLPPAPLPPSDAGAEMPAAAVPAPPGVVHAGVGGASAAASSPAAAVEAAPSAPTPPRVAATPAPPPRAAAPVPPPDQQAAAAPAPSPDDGTRARALLEGAGTAPVAPSASASASRFVVQVGAYSDPAALRDARQRVERLGLKTYTQVVETTAGVRTRVRIGPFANRQEADAAAARVKGAGMPANILVL